MIDVVVVAVAVAVLSSAAATAFVFVKIWLLLSFWPVVVTVFVSAGVNYTTPTEFLECWC